MAKKLSRKQLEDLFSAAEPLCKGDTSDLWDWLVAGNDGADITGYSAQDVANEWNDLTDQAEGR